MARDRVLQIRCSAAEMESLENFAQGWGGPVSAYVRKVLFGTSPRVKGEEKMPSSKVRVESYLEEKTREVADGLKQARNDAVRQILDAPPADAPIAGLKFTVTAEEKAELRKAPKIPEGHGPKCTCLKCQKAKGWRG